MNNKIAFPSGSRFDAKRLLPGRGAAGAVAVDSKWAVSSHPPHELNHATRSADSKRAFRPYRPEHQIKILDERVALFGYHRKPPSGPRGPAPPGAAPGVRGRPKTAAKPALAGTGPTLPSARARPAATAASSSPPNAGATAPGTPRRNLPPLAARSQERPDPIGPKNSHQVRRGVGLRTLRPPGVWPEVNALCQAADVAHPQLPLVLSPEPATELQSLIWGWRDCQTRPSPGARRPCLPHGCRGGSNEEHFRDG